MPNTETEVFSLIQQKKRNKPIPQNWTDIELGEIGDFYKGKGISNSQKKESGIPCITYGELYTKHHEIIKSFYSYIDEATAKESTQLEYGDILIAGSGETLEEIGKCAAFVNDLPTYAGGDIIILRQKTNDPYFLGYMLNSDVSKNQKIKLGQGHSVVHIYSSTLKKLKIPLPPLVEQQKIARILSSWDKAIALQQQLITHKQTLKKGLMQQLLTGKMRFKEFVKSQNFKKSKLGLIPEDWEIDDFSSLLKTYYLGGNYDNSEDNNGIPLMKMGNLSRGEFVLNKVEKIAGNTTFEKRHILKEGYLLLNTRNTLDLVGKVAIWKNELKEALFNSNLIRLVFNQRIESSNEFANLYLNSFDGLKQLKSFAIGTTSVAAVYTRDILKLKMIVPPIKEQQKIAQVLSAIDQEISILKVELGQLQKQKKGLMQKLLTGELRVKIA